MIARSRAGAPWLLAAAWAAVRVALPPPGHNTHTLMYPLVEAAGSYNTLEPFHPLYHPVVALVRWAWEAFGGAGPALPALQAVSLLAGAANIILLHRVALRVTGKEAAAFGAAGLLALTQNLWSWSLQTTSYTLATACVLAVADRLLAAERPGARDALWAGVWTGLAASFDTAAGLAALPAAYELRRRGGKGALGAFAGAAALVLAGSYAVLVHRLSLLGWPFPPTLAGLLASLPGDIVPLWKSLDLGGQLAAFWRSDAPADWPRLAAPAALALSWRPLREGGWRTQALWRAAAGLWAALTAFFFLNDPQNRFVYAGGLLLPAVLCAAVPRHWPAAAVLLFSFNVFQPPRYAPDGNPALREAEFLAGRLGSGDLLVALSEPDWLLSYGLQGRVPAVKLEDPEGSVPRFGIRPVTRDGAEAAIDAVLCGGGKAVFAADALYRSAGARDARARALVARWSKRYAPGEAWVSPQDQHYMPLAPRPGACAKERKA